MPPIESVIEAFQKEPLLVQLYLSNDAQSETLSKKIFVESWIDDFDSDRFKAEPVFAKTGKGYLKSNGVDGYILRGKKRDFRRTEEYSEYSKKLITALDDIFDPQAKLLSKTEKT